MPFTGPAINYGYDHNYFKKLIITNANYNTNCDILIPFSTYTVTFQLEAGSNIVYSFNGNHDAGDMTLNLPSQNLVFENRVISKIWFKGNGTCRIESWAGR